MVDFQVEAEASTPEEARFYCLNPHVPCIGYTVVRL